MAWPTVEEHPTPDIRELLVNPSTIDPPMTAYGMLRRLRSEQSNGWRCRHLTQRFRR